MIDAMTLTHDLGGRWHGGYGTAPCPVCQADRRKDQNALTLRDGNDARLLLHCKRLGCAFRDVLRAAGVATGAYQSPDPASLLKREEVARAKAAKRASQAEHLWREARPITGTIAGTYMHEARGITCALPDTLRFHPSCWHGPSASRQPALVAFVEGGDGFAVHRTYLRPDGSGKAAIVPNKAMLGAVAGGAVRVAEVQGTLVVAEGIETALSLAFGLLRSSATIWASLSTSGMRGLRLPPEPGRLTIAQDGDPAGHAAAHALAERAHAAGWVASLLPAPEGRDWNDILIRKGECK